MILVENGLKLSSFLHIFLVWMQLIPPREVHCLVCLQITDETSTLFFFILVGDCKPEALRRDQSELEHFFYQFSRLCG